MQPKVLEIIIDFLKEDEKNSKYFLHNNLSSWKNIFQYVYYSNVFPEIYCSTERRGFDLKSNFHIIFKMYKDQKKLEISLAKNLENYETIRNETSVFKQKPIKIDNFKEIEEKEIKVWVEKQKQKWQEVAEK